MDTDEDSGFKVWQCEVCGWIYDEEKGCPEEGLEPGTRWADVPEDWQCPECFASKSDFIMVEIGWKPTISAADEPYRAHRIDPQWADKPMVVVGTGLGGYDLVKALRNLGNTRPIIMVTADSGDYYPKPVISNSIGHRRSVEDIRICTADQMRAKHDLDIRIRTKVSVIDPMRHRITFSSGERITYSSLVLATGSVAIPHGLSGDAAGLVCQVNSLEDYEQFRSRLAGKRKVSVLGGGLIGIEFADDLATAGFEVTVIEMQDRVLAALLPVPAANAVREGLEAKGITFRLGTKAVRSESTANGVRLVLDSGETIEAEVVLSAIGVRPNVELARACGLEIRRGVVVNRFLETSEIDIFAIGDCAEVEGLVLPFVAPLTTAAAALAGTLNGHNTEVQYGVMPVHVKCSSVPVIAYRAPGSETAKWSVLDLEGTNCLMECRTETGALVGIALAGSHADTKNDYVSRLPPAMNERFTALRANGVPDHFKEKPRGFAQQMSHFWFGV